MGVDEDLGWAWGWGGAPRGSLAGRAEDGERGPERDVDVGGAVRFLGSALGGCELEVEPVRGPRAAGGCGGG